MNVNTRLFYGDYEINQLDADGNILGTDLFTLASDPICSFDSLNILSDGEFDDMTARDSWTINHNRPMIGLRFQPPQIDLGPDRFSREKS